MEEISVLRIILDVFVKSLESTTNVTPAKAGIQKYQMISDDQKILDQAFARVTAGYGFIILVALGKKRLVSIGSLDVEKLQLEDECRVRPDVPGRRSPLSVGERGGNEELPL